MAGNRAREKGSEWESYVRKDMEKDFHVVKFHNNFDLSKMKMVGAKPGHFRLMQTGFPDFMVWKKVIGDKYYKVNGVECKMDGILSKEEKTKCYWLLKNKVFQDIFIAHKTKVKNRIHIIYDDFREKYKKWIKQYETNDKK